jgi:hypothetical protein
LGQVFVVGMSGNAKVPQHCVGFPATEELDDVAVRTGAEQGCGSTRAEAARGEEGGVDACSGFELRGCDTEAGGDVSRVREAWTGRSSTVVGVDGCVYGSRVDTEVVTQPGQGFASWAKLGVRGSRVADLFAVDGVLLVVEHHVIVARVMLWVKSFRESSVAR